MDLSDTHKRAADIVKKNKHFTLLSLKMCSQRREVGEMCGWLWSGSVFMVVDDYVKGRHVSSAVELAETLCWRTTTVWL